ncbi:CS domain-containing protein [Mycena sanguinolenta]|uniref:CS domain-containing protein n=1 Tax=Mycena sanguinolenta TaxID=230812 RepID=A0A8H6YUG6_9AGAR|nr:CS domain-containing protein [Mycena sanguinolenta]
MSVHPEVLWAQRSSESDETKNILYLTINLPDIQENSLKYTLEPTKIAFEATSGNEKTGHEKKYAFSLDFYSEIVPEKSSKRLSSRSLYLVLRKKDQQAEYWPRLTKDKVKNAYIKTDFSKWVDEDEQDGQETKDDADLEDAMGGMPGMGMPGMPGMGMPGMPGMPGMGGMGGPGGMDFEKMMAEMGGAGGLGGMGGAGGFGAGGSGGGDDDDSDDDGPPPLEDAEAPK